MCIKSSLALSTRNRRTRMWEMKNFAVPHGEVPYAFGYRFETPDRTIVISGDTSPDGAIPQN